MLMVCPSSSYLQYSSLFSNHFLPHSCCSLWSAYSFLNSKQKIKKCSSEDCQSFQCDNLLSAGWLGLFTALFQSDKHSPHLNLSTHVQQIHQYASHVPAIYSCSQSYEHTVCLEHMKSEKPREIQIPQRPDKLGSRPVFLAVLMRIELFTHSWKLKSVQNHTCYGLSKHLHFHYLWSCTDWKLKWGANAQMIHIWQTYTTSL